MLHDSLRAQHPSFMTAMSDGGKEAVRCAHIAMSRASWRVLAEVEGVAHAHELQAGCCIQMAQQTVVSLVRDCRLANGAWCSAPQACVLQQVSSTALGHHYKPRSVAIQQGW